MAFDINTIGAALACGAGSSGGSSNGYVDASKIMTSASGSPAVIEDASNMPLEGIDFYGDDIKQKSYTGKNLLNLNGLKEHYHDGVTYTPVYDDNGYLLYINVNGKTESGTSYYDLTTMTIPAGTYIFSQGYRLEMPTIGLIIEWGEFPDDHSFVTWDGDDQDCRKTYTFDSDTEILIGIIASEYDDNVNLYPMIRLDDIKYYDDYDYEPYTGNKPSPNPDYPQPIESKIVNRVDVLRKNWLNPSGFATKTSNGVTFTPVFKDGLLQYINVNGTATADSYYTIIDKTNVPKEALVLNGCKGGSTSTYSLLITYRNEDDTYADQAFQPQADADLPIDASKKKYSVTIFVKSGATVNNARFYPMLRPSFFTDGTYEPYQSQTVNLSAPIELNGIGGVRDTDKVKNIYVKVFTGNESFRTYTPGVGGVQFGCEDENIPQIESDNVLCTHLPPKFTWNVREDGIALTNNSVVVRFRIESLGISTVEDLKAKLKEWYNAGNPMVLYAPIKTPIETALPQADIDAIKTLHTYKTNTVVMNDADVEMDVHYVADAKTYIDKKFEALAKAVLNQ